MYTLFLYEFPLWRENSKRVSTTRDDDWPITHRTTSHIARDANTFEMFSPEGGIRTAKRVLCAPMFGASVLLQSSQLGVYYRWTVNTTQRLVYVPSRQCCGCVMNAMCVVLPPSHRRVLSVLSFYAFEITAAALARPECVHTNEPIFSDDDTRNILGTIALRPSCST